MPFQYKTFSDGEPLSSADLQKTTNNQYELDQTYEERGRGLIASKRLYTGETVTGTSMNLTNDETTILSFSATIYPGRYYLLESQIGLLKWNTNGMLPGLFLYLKIANKRVAIMNIIVEPSTSIAQRNGAYISHIFQASDFKNISVPSSGKKLKFQLTADDLVPGDDFTLAYSTSNYQGETRLSLIDMGAVQRIDLL